MNGPVEESANEVHDALPAYQDLAREHDRLRTLFDITNAVVSKLGRDELFSAISEQLSNIIRHDYTLLTLRTQAGGLEVFALHCTHPQLLHLLKGPFEPEGMPSSEVLSTGKAAVVRDPRFARYVGL